MAPVSGSVIVSGAGVAVDVEVGLIILITLAIVKGSAVAVGRYCGRKVGRTGSGDLGTHAARTKDPAKATLKAPWNFCLSTFSYSTPRSPIS